VSKYYDVGKAIEYKLVSILHRHGFLVVRAPASGRRCRRIYYPDVVAVKNGKTFIFEVKLLNKPKTLWIKIRHYYRLKEVEERSNGKAFIAVYVADLKEFRFIPLEKINKFTNNYFKLSVHDVAEGLRLDDILKLA